MPPPESTRRPVTERNVKRRAGDVENLRTLFASRSGVVKRDKTAPAGAARHRTRGGKSTATQGGTLTLTQQQRTGNASRANLFALPPRSSSVFACDASLFADVRRRRGYAGLRLRLEARAAAWVLASSALAWSRARFAPRITAGHWIAPGSHGTSASLNCC